MRLRFDEMVLFHECVSKQTNIVLGTSEIFEVYLGSKPFARSPAGFRDQFQDQSITPLYGIWSVIDCSKMKKRSVCPNITWIYLVGKSRQLYADCTHLLLFARFTCLYYHRCYAQAVCELIYSLCFFKFIYFLFCFLSMIYAANHCEAIDADHVNVESGVRVPSIIRRFINVFFFFCFHFLGSGRIGWRRRSWWSGVPNLSNRFRTWVKDQFRIWVKDQESDQESDQQFLPWVYTWAIPCSDV